MPGGRGSVNFSETGDGVVITLFAAAV